MESEIERVKAMLEEMNIGYRADNAFVSSDKDEGGYTTNLRGIKGDISVVSVEYNNGKVDGTLIIYPKEKTIEFGDGPNIEEGNINEFVQGIRKVADEYGYVLKE